MMTGTSLTDAALILALDLEATCADERSVSLEDMEIIEIGALWATPDGTVLDRLQSFVRLLE
jgi:inhibitor of KinA sporulation pathway (predicted exonuclease)